MQRFMACNERSIQDRNNFVTMFSSQTCELVRGGFTGAFEAIALIKRLWRPIE